MAKRKTKKHDTHPSIPGLNLEGALRFRRHDSLFLPALLRAASGEYRSAGAEQDAAFAVLTKWADLESSGQLASIKETSANADFLNTVFGTALGYRTKTDDPADYGVEREYHVPGVGPVDGALGLFPGTKPPIAVIELKSADTDLDRDKSYARTAVRQAWDYLNALPDCPWAIVSNFSVIRLYHRNKTTRAYEEFTLQQLRDRDTFNQFHFLLKRSSLFPSAATPKAPTLALLERTGEKQEEVGEKLYQSYREQRNRLISHLVHEQGKPLDTAIRIAQKLLDRVVFIAFCEDRGLLPPATLERAGSQVQAFSKATNPRWQNFVGLFSLVDKGGAEIDLDVGFNGGLFKHDPEVDDLQLADVPFANGLQGFGKYDFAQEVNVEVLGHLFERSITELEKLRVGGAFALTGENGKEPAMEKSAQRKRMGIYYTPPAFTGLIVSRTIDVLVEERFAALAAKRGVDRDTGKDAKGKYIATYWRECLAVLRGLKVVDPACGSGAFLIRAYDALEGHYAEVVGHIILAENPREDDARVLRDAIPDFILSDNLHGVDLSEEGVEITQLALWIRSARKGRSLRDLSKNIVRGNSLVDTPEVAGRDADGKSLGMVWKDTFPEVFGRKGDGAGFDCVIGNPPWERVRLESKKFFEMAMPSIAKAKSAAIMDGMIDGLKASDPELHQRWAHAMESSERMAAYARQSNRYPLTAKGDVNLYALFAELMRAIVAPAGLIGVLVPSAIATHDKTKEFFGTLMSERSLAILYDFENREKVFADVDNRFKFCVLVLGGKSRVSKRADFVFFAHAVEDADPLNAKRHIPLTAADIARVNPNTRTCPIFRTRRDAKLTIATYEKIPILIDENRTTGGNPWGIKFLRMFDQAADSKLFKDEKFCRTNKLKLRGNVYEGGAGRFVPLYEAKMIQAFDHRASSVLESEDNAIRTGDKAETLPVQYANPEFAVLPRWWVPENEVAKVMGDRAAEFYLCYKRVTSATNERTVIASFVPKVAVAHPAPIMLIPKEIAPPRRCCLLANLNSYALDFIARQKVGSTDLDYFVMRQLPVLGPDTYTDKCPWNKRETLEHWISERVLKLSCTAEDMIPLANACGFKGSRGDGVHIWKEQERAEIRAELDAAFFHLYGVERNDAEYMLSTFTGTGFIAEERRDSTGRTWEQGSSGEMILRAFDHLSGRGPVA